MRVFRTTTGMLLALLLALPVMGAETTTATVEGIISDLSVNEIPIRKLVLTYQYNPGWAAIPVNGYLETDSGIGLLFGTAFATPTGAIRISLNSVPGFPITVETDNTLSGQIGVHGSDGQFLDVGTISFQDVP